MEIGFASSIFPRSPQFLWQVNDVMSQLMSGYRITLESSLMITIGRQKLVGLSPATIRLKLINLFEQAIKYLFFLILFYYF